MSKDETNLTDAMVRHPKWEKVETGYEFQAGEPYRRENRYVAVERRRNYSFIGDGCEYFRDTTWQAPVKPPKVGDLIETVEQAESLPIETMAVSRLNTAFRKEGMNEWRRVAEGGALMAVDFEMAGHGDRIIYLPGVYYAE